MSTLIFDSTHQALRAERILEEKGLEIDIVALPDGYTADCGLAIEFAPGDRVEVEVALAGERIRFKQIIG